MKHRYLTAGALFFAVIVVGCSRKTDSHAGSQQPLTVSVEKAVSKTRVATEEDIGTVRARLHSVIEAKVSGKIDQMLVVPGQQVTNGELLATIDAREIKARFDQATAVRQQAESEFKRASDLLQQKTLSQSEFDAIQSRFRVAEAAAAEAETLLGYTKITAPFSGLITRKDVDVGDLAVPGKSLLEMEDASHLRLEADVPEALIEKIKLGDTLPVRISASETNFAGVVSEIAPSADTSSRTFVVKLDLPQQSILRAGQFGRVAIPAGEVLALRVSASAVVKRGQLEFLFVAIDGRAQLRIVKTGARIGDETEIISGLNSGELVVTAPLENISDGQPLNVKP